MGDNLSDHETVVPEVFFCFSLKQQCFPYPLDAIMIEQKVVCMDYFFIPPSQLLCNPSKATVQTTVQESTLLTSAQEPRQMGITMNINSVMFQ